MVANTLHTPELLATLVVGYSGRVPKIYKVRWAPEIDRVEFSNRDGVKRNDKFVAIGFRAPYALAVLDHTLYALDMPREKVKSLVQDALTHASLCDCLTRGGMD
ncbi:uncharacterized protein Pyn_07079 [Prunus yedoensis var. nudiflora]|uniref:Uncharacterized protein n=1 Tax=Prunus yedoensis var. nudiflora TaxID=2094558 RepID=A0A314ZM99_PRUYE|nr:uncharacterized protein Pyn_07079 [Prunus yedoensis var. nudiflora]